MNHFRSKPVFPIIAMCVLASIGMIFFVVLKPKPLKAQSSEVEKIKKQIRREKYRNEPYEFSGMTFKRPPDYQGPEITSTRGNVNTANDWLRGFAFTLKNISEKPMVWVRVRFVFPKTKDTPDLGFDTYLGRRDPKSTYFDEMLLSPGEKVDFVLSDKEFVRLKQFVIRAGGAFELLPGVDFKIQAVGFPDNTKWDTGDMYEPDPDNPDKYRKLSTR